MLASESENLGSALCQQGLVAGDDDAARFDRGDRQVERFRRSADEFDDDLDLRILEKILPSAGKESGRRRDIAFLLGIAHDNPAHIKAVSGSLRDQVAVAFQILIDPGTDGAEAGQSDADRSHKEPMIFSVREAPVKPLLRRRAWDFGAGRRCCSLAVVR